MAAPSSPTRESTTLSSFSRQNGQRTAVTVLLAHRGVAGPARPFATISRAVVRARLGGSAGSCTGARVRIFANAP
jgi:hypothetical protein